MITPPPMPVKAPTVVAPKAIKKYKISMPTPLQQTPLREPRRRGRLEAVPLPGGRSKSQSLILLCGRIVQRHTVPQLLADGSLQGLVPDRLVLRIIVLQIEQ